MAIKSLFNQKMLWSHGFSVDEYGDRDSGTEEFTTLYGRIDDDFRETVDSKGSSIESRGHNLEFDTKLYVSGDTDISIEDRIKYPYENGNTYKVIGVKAAINRRGGTHHKEVYLKYI